MPGSGLGNGTETRSYNNLNQLTGIASPFETVTYSYPVSTNNGQIASMTSGGQTVSYTYDALGGIATASAAGGTAWGQSYVFDGFGNLLQKNVTAGSAPSLAQSVNTANNQINGFSYDANGNQTGVPVPGAGTVTAAYDIENRMVQLGTAGKYAYNAQNQRVWRQGTESGTTSEYFYFYGVGGQRAASYKITNYPPVQAFGNVAAFSVQATDVLVYYGSKLLQEGAYTTNFSPNYVGVDRLGSMPGGKSLYPWGEEVTATANDKIKFATYLRDGESGVDYAMNRYYSSPTGRFLTADPYGANNGGSGDPSDPQSWNRYAYVSGDPVNGYDPSGLVMGWPGSGGSGSTPGFDGGYSGGGFSGICGSTPTSGFGSFGSDNLGYGPPWNPANLCSLGMSMFFAPGPAPGGGGGSAARPTVVYSASLRLAAAFKDFRNCAKVLGATDKRINSLLFVDGTKGGSMDYAGASDHRTFAEFYQGQYGLNTTATTLLNSNGGASNVIVLWASYFLEDAVAKQGNPKEAEETLIHEYIHATFNLADPKHADIIRKFKISGFGGAANGQVDQWIMNDCANPK
jgi:RHS repeat-associated protein